MGQVCVEKENPHTRYALKGFQEKEKSERNFPFAFFIIPLVLR